MPVDATPQECVGVRRTVQHKVIRDMRNSVKLSPYRAVNTLRLGYKNQSVNAV
jgi:hypothetical protein